MTSKAVKFALLATLIGTPAFAADMAVKAPPLPAAPVSTWTGSYLGLNAGGAWGRDELNAVPADPGTTAFWAGCFAAGACPRDYGRGHGSSVEFGGQAGYNKQINNYVLGIETDLQWTHASSNSAVTNAGVAGFVPFNGQATSKFDWFGTTRARVGILANPSMLLYGTGGVAYGSVTRSWTANFVPPASQMVTGTDRQGTYGWTAGGGAEWMFAPHWILGVEYLYMKFNSETFAATGAGSAGCTAANCNFSVRSGGPSMSVARLKVDYKF